MIPRIAGFTCVRCGRDWPYEAGFTGRGCPRCWPEAPANLRVRYSAEARREWRFPARDADTGSLWRYAAMLPIAAADAVSLQEGMTPLIEAARFGGCLGVPRLLIKDETRNPTWSFKDRLSTLAVSAARLAGARVVATSSSGNAGASLAAYAARAGLDCVVVSFGQTAGPLLAQIRRYGARVVVLPRKADRWPLLAHGAERFGWFVTSPHRDPAIGSHPLGVEGYKTLAFELVEQMGGTVPDWCVLPVCYGDALAGMWQGFAELCAIGAIDRLPRMVAAEVSGSLGEALASGSDCVPEAGGAAGTVAVSIGASRSTFQALRVLRDSNGTAVQIANEALLRSQRALATSEGILAELSSVAPFPAIAALRASGVIAENATVVALVTASGLKDLDRSGPDDSGLASSEDDPDAILNAIERDLAERRTAPPRIHRP